jgi:iron complex transport system substrate-binding protein
VIKAVIRPLLLIVVSLTLINSGIAQTRQVTTIKEKQPSPQRIISLAPNVTEILFAIGAGPQLVGAIEPRNYPAAAQQLASVGRYPYLNLEQITKLEPDLIIAWRYGLTSQQFNQLKTLGYSVALVDPKQLTDIAKLINRLGRLTGQQTKAQQLARQFKTQLAELQKNYAGKTPVKVFFELNDTPLTTVNSQQIISQVIELCGGYNIFGTLKIAAPQVNVEEVLARDPAAIIIVQNNPQQGQARHQAWQQWSTLSAVKQQHIYLLPADHISRFSPRILLGAKQLCQDLAPAGRQSPAVQ